MLGPLGSSKVTTIGLSSRIDPRSSLAAIKSDLHTRFATREAEPLDRAAQLMRGDTGVALRRVEVLVSEQLLDLAQIRARAEELGCEHVPERVRRHPLPLRYPGGAGV